jgi:hypothetical protein
LHIMTHSKIWLKFDLFQMLTGCEWMTCSWFNFCDCNCSLDMCCTDDKNQCSLGLYPKIGRALDIVLYPYIWYVGWFCVNNCLYVLSGYCLCPWYVRWFCVKYLVYALCLWYVLCSNIVLGHIHILFALHRLLISFVCDFRWILLMMILSNPLQKVWLLEKLL